LHENEVTELQVGAWVVRWQGPPDKLRDACLAKLAVKVHVIGVLADRFDADDLLVVDRDNGLDSAEIQDSQGVNVRDLDWHISQDLLGNVASKRSQRGRFTSAGAE